MQSMIRVKFEFELISGGEEILFIAREGKKAAGFALDKVNAER